MAKARFPKTRKPALKAEKWPAASASSKHLRSGFMPSPNIRLSDAEEAAKIREQAEFEHERDGVAVNPE